MTTDPLLPADTDTDPPDTPAVPSAELVVRPPEPPAPSQLQRRTLADWRGDCPHWPSTRPCGPPPRWPPASVSASLPMWYAAQSSVGAISPASRAPHPHRSG